jgi:hypothetical protein
LGEKKMKKLIYIITLLFVFGFATLVSSDTVTVQVFAGPIDDSLVQPECTDKCGKQAMTWAGSSKRQGKNVFCICTIKK